MADFLASTWVQQIKQDKWCAAILNTENTFMNVTIASAIPHNTPMSQQH